MPKQTTDTTPIPSSPEPDTNGPKMGKFLSGLAVVLLLATTGAAGYYYNQFDQLKKHPNKAAADETAATIAAVGKLLVLPAGETPTLATVTEPDKLKDQPFFAFAKKGDKVLIYTKAKKAVLYNPTENKIVEVAPVNIGSSTSDQSQVSGSTTTTKK
ncbi:MAG: hypothetical protein KW802_01945 [Candidatus Doudnabacteria bacterium]|nr:hypothetical protein [Candidatus Doudnabacteria bacterium]